MTAYRSRTTLGCAMLLAGLLLPPIAAGEPAGPDPEEDEGQVDIDELARSPAPMPPTIQAAPLPAAPAPGQGRLSLVFEGNRRWCTYPDDRVVRPPERLVNRGRGPDRNSVYTFGYQFSVAAIERSRPYETLLLFESPIFRTAVYRQAAKLGKATPVPHGGPAIGQPPETIEMKPPRISPSALIPAWQEQYRCTKLPEAIDLDLRPGTYDVYLAFDILLRSGNWTHRSVGYGTDITVEEGRTTRVAARANMAGASRRELEILGAEVAEPVAPAEQP